MIVKRVWFEQKRLKASGIKVGPEWAREGWFLFGVIPLYIRDLSPRGRL